MTGSHEEGHDVGELGPLLFTTNSFFNRAFSLRPSEDVPLDGAKQVAALVEEAAKIVHDPKHIFLGDPGAPSLSDAVVAEVMRGLQAQLDREGQSRTRGATCGKHKQPHTCWYHLSDDLPPARQRALAERLWRVWKEWGGTVRVYRTNDDVSPAPTLTSPGGVAGTGDWGYYEGIGF